MIISTILSLFYILSCASNFFEPIAYMKRPSTGGEVAVAKSLETMITAYNKQDINKYLSCFAPDARIDSKIAGRVVSINEHL